MKSGEEDGGGRDVGVVPRIGQAGGGGPEIENLIEVAGEGREFVGGPFLRSYKCKLGRTPAGLAAASVIYFFRPRLRSRSRSRRNNSRLISEIFSMWSFNFW